MFLGPLHAFRGRLLPGLRCSPGLPLGLSWESCILASQPVALPSRVGVRCNHEGDARSVGYLGCSCVCRSCWRQAASHRWVSSRPSSRGSSHLQTCFHLPAASATVCIDCCQNNIQQRFSSGVLLEE